MPYMLNSNEANWRQGGHFVRRHQFGVLRVVLLQDSRSRGRTFEKLDIMFEQEIPPRQFAKYNLLDRTEKV